MLSDACLTVGPRPQPRWSGRRTNSASASTRSPVVFLLGTGVVGGAFLDIVGGHLPIDVRLAGVANSRGAVLLGERTPAFLRSESLTRLIGGGRSQEPSPIGDHVLDVIEARGGVLVDATASGSIGELYERALARGIDVVTANKKPLAGPWAARERLFDARRRGQAKLRYEATVGAGLPVIETTKNLVRTGDRIRRIDCVLSGTLGFLANALAEGTPLSKAVAIARRLGYTEPDPREDLAGGDVARKAVILARELGAQIETSDVALEPFVPRDVLALATPETIEQDLAKLDTAFASQVERLRERGEKLVYLARIDVDDTGTVQASAGPVAVPSSHPAARLEGSSALVAFTTARYARDPLVVHGAGAGGAVTASALLADVFAAKCDLS